MTQINTHGRPSTEGMHTYPIPTGFLFVDSYSRGQLETLSIGDYGKPANVKADFLGLTRDIDGVPNGSVMPLSEKWVVTLSTQYGCPMKCTFCDVPNIKFNGNASFQDLQDQLYNALTMFPGVHYAGRLNLHYARMGEPAYNQDVLNFTRWLWHNKAQIQADTGVAIDVLHPVFTTSCPRKLKKLSERVHEWVGIKNDLYNGQAGLQLSINSTSDAQRDDMFAGQALPLADIAAMVADLPAPLGRKYCLNFAYASGFEVDATKLAGLFDPDKFMVKITPIHNNTACRTNGIATIGGYESYQPYRQPEEALKNAGFDVLVFVPSMDEEQGLVTCGNAVLAGRALPLVLPPTERRVEGPISGGFIPPSTSGTGSLLDLTCGQHR